MRTIGKHDRGAAVEDVQRRLRVLGYELEVDGEFGERTRVAVEAFREKARLPKGDTVDDLTWSALVDASFALGDRVLYLRMPYFHGGDVEQLQQILDVLGFISGGADGIFGAHTEQALREFQSSVGLVDDGIAGNTTYEAIGRLRHAWDGKAPVSSDADDHMGFARAAEVLERIEACFYGLDEQGRAIASRVANLAWATTPAARVTSADALGGMPPAEMLKIGIGAHAHADAGVTPVIELEGRGSFAQRLRTAVAASDGTSRRVIIEVPSQDGPAADVPVEVERWEQHLAVVVLDAFCGALRP